MGNVVPFRRQEADEAWVTKRELAAYFGVAPKTIERWAKAGMPHMKPSPQIVRFQVGDCEEWLTARS